MSHFYLHFFKEKSRVLDMEEVIEFFDHFPGFDVEMDEKSVRFLYQHPHLGYPCTFYITPKSKVPNIQRLSPKYLEVNFHLELPIFTPTYVVKHIIHIVKKICDEFNLFVLSEMFQDVLEFNAERILRVFQMVKKAYLEKFPEKYKDFHFIKEEKLSGVLRYIDERDALQKYYKDLDIILPKYHFIEDENHEPFIAIEWKENTQVVFPPYLDYLLFNQTDGMIKVISYQEFLKNHDKHLQDVPGFLQGTKVIPKKTYKLLNKKAKKHKWEPVSKSFTKINLNAFMDA
ncbi:Uncharacterised protein [Acholeplasma oculi]|uniref:Uncharacterized protein n=1 Tax=Acholeplasma oculi TaxID=35623 RepID=A0A061AGX6_9MOLU|nr:hypothetical protein [Acholeplasma oculi]CDR30841.1 hypothetical protein Aocu_07680 [Acholeplasma oculi]SKC35214.1 hypothetical protein SAMN02745122_0193 [Acholeplasma oculi]SUT89889.1 Uncharacterised protein [Acholeplasma oculi]